MLFPIITAGLKQEKFGKQTLFLEGSKVSIIEQNDGSHTTYMAFNEDKTQYKLIMENAYEKNSYVCDLPPKTSIFIIPNITARKDVSFIKQVDIKRIPYPDIIYEIVSYGVLDSPNFEGSLFSNSYVCIAVQNCKGETYSLSYHLSENIVAGSGHYKGTIEGAYIFKPIMTLLPDGNVIL